MPARSRLEAFWRRPYIKAHQPFSVTTQDGVTLSGVHLRSGQDTLFIYCHGFLASKDYAVIPRFVELLAEDGDAIAFDFRGHGDSEGMTALGEHELLDLDAVMDYARGQGYRRILLVGSSMGGATVLRYAAAHPDVAGVATIGAFAHPGLTGIAEVGLLLARYGSVRALARFVRNCRISEGLQLPSPLAVVGQISPRPLLLIHGEFDPLISVRQAHELYAAAGPPKELIVIPHGGHDLDNLRRWTKDWIVEWFQANR